MTKPIKPSNCICEFPEVIFRNGSGHNSYCPVHIEYQNKFNYSVQNIYNIKFSLNKDQMNEVMENLGIRIAMGDIDKNSVEFIIFQQILIQAKEQGYKK